MLTKIRGAFQTLISGIAEKAHEIGVTPNVMSLIGLILSIISAILYYSWRMNKVFVPLAATLFLLSGLCDALDGLIARKFGESSTFGGILDSVFDRFEDALIIGSLIIGGLCDLTWGLVSLVGSYLVSYSRARSEAEGISMETIGFAERAERILIIVGASFFIYEISQILTYAMILISILTLTTVLQRMVYARRMASRRVS